MNDINSLFIWLPDSMRKLLYLNTIISLNNNNLFWTVRDWVEIIVKSNFMSIILEKATNIQIIEVDVEYREMRGTFENVPADWKAKRPHVTIIFCQVTD